MKKIGKNIVERVGLVSIYRQLPFLYFLAVLGIFYVMIAHKMEHKMRVITDLKAEVKEERARFLTTKSKYMYMATRSEVEKRVKEEGLMNDPSNVYVIRSKSNEAEN